MIGEDFDKLLKLVIVGDSGAGKTNLLCRYASNQFSYQSKPTIGVEFQMKSFKIDNKKIKVQIWDTAGQDRFKSIAQAYYRGASGALLVFDLTKRQSFDNLNKWFQLLRENAEENIVTILVGNKADLHTQRVIKQDQGLTFAQNNKMHYVETSALNGTNVQQAFMCVIQEILSQSSIKEMPTLRNSIRLQRYSSQIILKRAKLSIAKEIDEKVVLKQDNNKKIKVVKKTNCC